MTRLTVIKVSDFFLSMMAPRILMKKEEGGGGGHSSLSSHSPDDWIKSLI